MLTRLSSRSRIAHRSDSSSEGTPSPCLSPMKPPSFPLRRKFQLSFLRFRISSLLRLLRSMSMSCRQALQAILMPKKPKKKSQPRMGTAFSAQCTRSACAPDAIADCIEFIKKSSSSSSFSPPSSSSSSSSSPSSPQPSSPSLSNSPFSPLSPQSSRSLSSRLLSSYSRSSQYTPSCLHHNSLSSPHSISLYLS